MNRVILYDLDSKIPNLALMKISSFYKKMGYEVILCRQIEYIKGSRYFASTVFHTPKSGRTIPPRAGDVHGNAAGHKDTGADHAAQADHDDRRDTDHSGGGPGLSAPGPCTFIYVDGQFG